MSCWTPVRGRRMRITRVNECGAPIFGDCSQVVTSGIVSVEFSPQTDDGEDIQVRTMAGDLCVSVPACRTLTGVEVTINFCRVDTDLFALATGEDPVPDAEGEGNGFDIGDLPCNVGFALELWTGIHSDTPCGEEGQAEYGYILFPWLSSGALGDFTVEDGAVTFSLTATARSGSGWGVGPYDVQMDAGGDPGPLVTPLPSDKFGRIMKTMVPPPDAECGCQPLEPPTVESIDVTPDSPTVAAGETVQLTATATMSNGTTQDVTSTATWTSSDEAVATVDAAGLVSGLTEGPTTITATVDAVDGVETLTVTAPVISSIEVTPDSPNLTVGGTQQMTATATMSDSSTQDVTATAVWASSDEAVATIDAAGLAEGVAAGTADLSATEDGVSGSTTATVA